MKIYVHAPDGGSIPAALCEEPSGDVADQEHGVDCPECLDQLDQETRTFHQLAAPIQHTRRQLRGIATLP